MDPHRISLDQLRIFDTVVAQGGLSAAARALNRAQASISYAIGQLEADLSVELFTRSGYRLVLNDHGRALLASVRRILDDAAALAAQAAGLSRGLEAEVGIVLDSMYPIAPFAALLGEFGREFETVGTNVHVESLGAAVDLVLDERADLGLTTGFLSEHPELERRTSLFIDLVPVCAPSHPLAALARDDEPLTTYQVRDHLQLVLSDRSERTGGLSHGIVSTRRWRVADLGAKHAMLLAGLGWGGLPRHLADRDLAAGRLLILRLEKWDGRDDLPRIEMVVTSRADRRLGPAASWLRDRLSHITDAPGTIR